MNYDALINAQIEKAEALEALATSENRALSTEELKQYEAHIAEAESLKAQKADFEAKQNRLKAFSKPVRANVNAATPVLVENVKESFKDDPKCGFANSQEFFNTIMFKGSSDERLRFLSAAGSDEQQGLDDMYGGFLIPEGFMPQLMSTSPDIDPTIGRTTMIPMGNKVIRVPARVDQDNTTTVTGGIALYRRQETQAIQSSRTNFEQIKLEANCLDGAVYVSDELISDSAVSIPAIINNAFGEAYQDRMFEEKLRGTGVGEYEGVLNCPAKVSVTKESGQAADTIVAKNLLGMMSQCIGYNNAIWIASFSTIKQLGTLETSTGSPGLFLPSYREGLPMTLLGRPIYFNQYMAPLGDEGDILLADWSYYLEGQLGGPEVASSVHVRFLNHQSTFRFSTRNDGRSWFRRSQTTKRSQPARSPFVTLAARA